jgi:hypothetical protein
MLSEFRTHDKLKRYFTELPDMLRSHFTLNALGTGKIHYHRISQLAPF